jgi:Permuted papain-like amidase enzyme, YaeF/YiiX, C92 family
MVFSKVWHNLRSLTPAEIGPWWSHRHKIYDELYKIGIKPGDILCRRGNAVVYGFFPFSDFICYLTGSKYSHAALVIDTKDDILMADVSTAGLRRQFIYDWLDEVRGEDFVVMRYNGKHGNEQEIPKLAVENAKKLIKIDPMREEAFKDYDISQFYCVELVCWCYLRAGVNLCEEVPICNLPNWKNFLKVVARIEGIDYNQPVWCVGNEKIGLLASKHLNVIATIKFPHHENKVKRRERLSINGA